jgi:hypothetical protein
MSGGHVRIRCRMPALNGPFVVVPPSIADCDVTMVRADGGEEPIVGVESISFRVSANNEVARAVLVLSCVELDLDLLEPEVAVHMAARAEVGLGRSTCPMRSGHEGPGETGEFCIWCLRARADAGARLADAVARACKGARQ